ncbi:hypothetical protein [Sporosarcina sp. HYO08]|uniref:hypothetical protein n=1 Tax=Sporosarcina sp. HYO08 TaxID=1759557 RepID=UPI0007928B42|nr:hypothetical protein [Sporosarcina sp. HYO08]KXH83746.1 hypothetical protein AU377_02975 [Sporosarcina sp. HYO08]
MKKLLFQELKQNVTKRLIIFLVLLNLFPYLLFFVQKDSYAFIDELDTFSFIFDGIMVVFFIFFVVFIYLGEFSSLLNHKFIVYQRTRTSLKNILLTCMFSNMIITFIVFFVLVLHVFLFFFYIQPVLGIIQFFPEIHYLTTLQELLEFNIQRYTFTQLLEYNPMIFGIVFSFWVGLMASSYATIGFFTVLLFKNKLIGMSIPILFYIIGAFVFNLFDILEPFGMANAVFPFSSSQYPIHTILLNFVFYTIINLTLYVYTFKIKLHKLDDAI